MLAPARRPDRDHEPADVHAMYTERVATFALLEVFLMRLRVFIPDVEKRREEQGRQFRDIKRRFKACSAPFCSKLLKRWKTASQMIPCLLTVPDAGMSPFASQRVFLKGSQTVKIGRNPC